MHFIHWMYLIPIRNVKKNPNYFKSALGLVTIKNDNHCCSSAVIQVLSKTKKLQNIYGNLYEQIYKTFTPQNTNYTWTDIWKIIKRGFNGTIVNFQPNSHYITQCLLNQCQKSKFRKVLWCIQRTNVKTTVLWS